MTRITIFCLTLSALLLGASYGDAWQVDFPYRHHAYAPLPTIKASSKRLQSGEPFCVSLTTPMLLASNIQPPSYYRKHGY